MNILITGSAGFIASNLVVYLSDKYPNYKIIGLDRLDPCSNLNYIKTLKNKNYTFIKGDICNTDLVNLILNDYQIDISMHLAACTHVDNSFGNSIKFTESNILGTHILLECAKKYGKLKNFLFISSDEIYGSTSHHTNIASTENDKLEPTNPYASTKASGEHLVNSYRISFKLPTMITRSNNVYGIYQYPEN